MQCRACKSDSVLRFEAELSLTSPRFENLTAEPVYVCQEAVVCANCGFTELVIPPQGLSKVKKVKAAMTGE